MLCRSHKWERKVRKGVISTIIHKFYTGLEEAEHDIPDWECLVSPIATFKATFVETSVAFSQARFKVTIPHCLPEKYDLSLITVRCGKNGHKGFLREIYRKDDGHSAEIPYYQLDSRYIKVYTDHFCPIVCTSKKKICDSSLVILPFGSLDHIHDNPLTTIVKVKVY